MYLKQIELKDFRNHASAKFKFCNGVNCIVGDNGEGKTNLLDAINFLSSGKSFLNVNDQQTISIDKEAYFIKGEIISNDTQLPIVCAFRAGDKKKVKFGSQEYKKLSEHLGNYPVLFVGPNDTDLIRGGSENRRKFIDLLISQVDQEYVQALIKYHHTLKQKAAYLKGLKEFNKRPDHALLDQYDTLLQENGSNVSKKRLKYIHIFLPYIKDIYASISSDKENPFIQFDDIYSNGFTHNTNREADLKLKRTVKGIHTNDFVFRLNDLELKKYGSQGQQKSFLISLKLGINGFFKENFSKTPGILLDDIFDKLDEQRIDKLLQVIDSDKFGQIFITDARPERTIQLTKDIKKDLNIINLNG